MACVCCRAIRHRADVVCADCRLHAVRARGGCGPLIPAACPAPGCRRGRGRDVDNAAAEGRRRRRPPTLPLTPPCPSSTPRGPGPTPRACPGGARRCPARLLTWPRSAHRGAAGRRPLPFADAVARELADLGLGEGEFRVELALRAAASTGSMTSLPSSVRTRASRWRPRLPAGTEPGAGAASAFAELIGSRPQPRCRTMSRPAINARNMV